MARVLLTGATGFIGRHLLSALSMRGHAVHAAVRAVPSGSFPAAAVHPDMALDPDHDWRPALLGIDVVVHAAARAHVLKETESEPERAFQRSNHLATAALAEQAAAAGVRRFIFLSSVGVHGRTSSSALQPDSPIAPHNAYARSKWDAERALTATSSRRGMELSVLRPPLVYGAGVKANFANLASAVARGWPLPLGLVKNRRSLLGVRNLCDLVVKMVDHPDGAGAVLLPCDGEDMSTPELVRRIAAAMGRTARLWPVPPVVLRSAGVLAGKSATVDSLCGDLFIDAKHLRHALDWVPPHAIQDDIAAAVKAASY